PHATDGARADTNHAGLHPHHSARCLPAIRPRCGSDHSTRSTIEVMKRRRPLKHPLAELFLRAAESVTTSLSDSTTCRYQTTAHYFLRYLGTHHPELTRISHRTMAKSRFSWDN